MMQSSPKKAIFAILLILCFVVFFSLHETLSVSRSSTNFDSSFSSETSLKFIEEYSSEWRPRLPKALIIGFPKCGTSALRTFLTIHPGIVSPVLELRFFTENYSKGLEWYRNQMPPSTKDQITLEKTPSYIMSLQYLKRIREFDSKMKLIVIVRDPIIRLQSQYAHEFRTFPPGDPKPSFKAWCTDERYNRILHFAKYSYYVNLAYSVFSRNQILVLNEDNLERNPFSTLREVEQFLRLKSEFSKDMFVFSKKKGFYCFNKDHKLFPTVQEMVKINNNTACLGGDKGREHPDMDEAFRQRLVKIIRPQNEVFFSLIKKRFKWENF